MGDDDTSHPKTEETFHSTGIWPMASYINHCCCSNARRTFIGDMIFVRATRDLPPDTEITFWYQVPTPDGNYDERQSKFRRTWGFTCDCTMCQNDHATKGSVWNERKRLRSEAQKLLQPHRTKRAAAAAAAKAESLLVSLADTYNLKRPASEVPHLGMWDANYALAKMYYDPQQNRPDKAIHFTLKALASLGYVIEGGDLPRTVGTPLTVRKWGLMMDNNVKCWMLLSAAYRVVAPDIELQAVEYARTSYRVCVGEDETFLDTYGKRFRI